MEIKRVALVIFDIGGYTDFIRYNRETLGHAHEVISQLLETIVDKAEHPLVLNKFEGDAAFLYAESKGNEAALVDDVSRQVFALFPAFRSKALALSQQRSMCPCGACQSIGNLRLKAITHLGDAAFRKIRNFEEIAGEDVIVVHRLLKNAVESREYVLTTMRYFSAMPAALKAQGRLHSETYDVIGKLDLRVFDAA